MTRQLGFWGIAILLLCGALLLSGALLNARYQALTEDDEAVAAQPDIADVTFCTQDGAPQKLDLYFPKEAQKGALPLVVYLHGGAFVGGDKRKGSGLIDISEMVARGFAVASVNYRLAPASRFPAPLQDVKCAIRFLRANAAQYNLNPEQVGIWGGSAGGYLAAFVGLADRDAGFDVGEYTEQSSSVRAVADLFGPADLAAELNWLQQFLLYRAFGTTARDDPYLAHASPVNYVSTNAPPFLILHGEQDDVVPVAQSHELFARLKAAGVPAELVVVKNANHNFAPTGGPIQPKRQELTKKLCDFFEQHLR